MFRIRIARTSLAVLSDQALQILLIFVRDRALLNSAEEVFKPDN